MNTGVATNRKLSVKTQAKPPPKPKSQPIRLFAMVTSAAGNKELAVGTLSSAFGSWFTSNQSLQLVSDAAAINNIIRENYDWDLLSHPVYYKWRSISV